MAQTNAFQSQQTGFNTASLLVRDGMGEQKIVPINDDPRREYVSSRLNIWGGYIDGVRALPHSIDDVTRDLGADLYERMSFDPEIASLVNTVKAAVLSQIVDLNPAVTDETDKDYKMAITLRDHCLRSWNGMRPNGHIVLDNMLDGLFVGNKVAEKVYKDGQGPDLGKLVLSKISVKHRNAIFFVTDRFGNVVGFLPAITAAGYGQMGVSIYNPEIQELLDRDKFVVFAFRPKDGDPRGTSILRPAYNAWWLKMQIWPELLKYLAQFGGPSIIGFASPDSRNLPILDVNGNKIGTQTPEEIMLAQLEDWRNGAAAAFPPGSAVNVVQAVGNGEAFHKSIDLLDRQLSKAVTGQELATGEGKHQARAASEVHQDILELVIMFIKQLVCDMLYEDVFTQDVEINYGLEYARLTPIPSLGEVQKQDKAALMTAYTMAGWKTHASQWPAIDQELNAPPRDPASIQEELDNQAAAAKAALEPPKASVPPKPTASRSSAA